jgi:tetratricopeptide (TPR) repeat protein
MSRLHLIIFAFVLLSRSLGAQSNLGTYLKYAEEKYKAGDYYYSTELYQKAMSIDSNTISTLWNYAEALRAYKDYPKAEYYYAKVYQRENGTIYPMSLLYLGLMQKQNAKYDSALETFKKIKTKFAKDKKAYIYLKSKRELESCLWAKSAASDSANVVADRLPENINTKNTEFGHAIHDNNLFFSSLRADSINISEEVYSSSYVTRIYRSKKSEAQFDDPKVLKEFIFKGLNTGNGSFSKDGSRFYFSLCNNEDYNYRCKIMVATYANGRLSRIDSLGSIINTPGSNTTMPFVAELNGEEVLFFSSDRIDGQGGMDLWYSVVKNGSQFGKPINLTNLNSMDNELSPWFDTIKKRLYFSSSWHDGFGGYDIFQSSFNGQFSSAQNIGQPFNSPANDLYYFQFGDTAYFSSNRMGVSYSKNPTCCSDIFFAYPTPPPSGPIQLDSIPILANLDSVNATITRNNTPPTKENLFALTQRLPVTLYFHNDCPNPNSRDTLTNVNYINGYEEYRAMLPKYQLEYSSGMDSIKANTAREDIENFFIQYIDKGAKDLELFTTLLIEELKQGSKINLTLQGFASPLAKTNYNVNLTKRRISSFVNYLSEYDNGIFNPYLNGTATNGGRLQFTQVPFGEYTANKLTSDNLNDQKNSVYSRAAAIERKIEILRVDYMKEDSLVFITQIIPSVLDLAFIRRNETFERKLVLNNKSADTLRIARTEVDEELIILTMPEALRPNSSVEISFTQNKTLPAGLFSIQAKLFFVGHQQPLLIMINGEGH